MKIGNAIKFFRKEGSQLRWALSLLLRSCFYVRSILFTSKRDEEFKGEIILFNFTFLLFLLKIPEALIKFVDVLTSFVYLNIVFLISSCIRSCPPYYLLLGASRVGNVCNLYPFR